MQAVAHELEVPVCWGGCWDSLLAIASPEDSVADYVAACRATGQEPFLDGPHFELPWAEYPA
jgi:peptidoglycan LD-endopeptidase CwlK